MNKKNLKLRPNSFRLILTSCFVAGCLAFCIYGCQEINQNDLTIIHDIQLGTEAPIFYKQLDSLKLENKEFFTNEIFTTAEELISDRIEFYYTDMFDMEKYSGGYVRTIGLIYPIIPYGMRHITELNILLAHTTATNLVSNRGIYNVTKEYGGMTGLVQDLPTPLVDSIENLLNKKYGKAKRQANVVDGDVYVVRKNKIDIMKPNKDNPGTKLTWDSKHYTVSLFKGVNSVHRTYSNGVKGYITHFANITKGDFEFSDNEDSCKSFCFIKYELKPETLKKLGINTPNL